MTNKLYYIDSYTTQFTASVLSCTVTDKGFAVVLDRTAFFPEGGGQYADTGKIGEARVLDVQISKDGTITHYTDSEVPENTTVSCSLDFEKRLRKMQNHSGEHIVSGLVHSLYGFDNVGFHLGNGDVTMDYNGVLCREDLLKIEKLANIACAENIEITASFPGESKLSQMEYRSKLELSENVRIVEIPGYDTCACCAPHVARTGAIGMIKLLDFIKYKGGVRVHMKCGLDALEDYNDKYSNIAAIAERLSVRQTDADSAVERLEKELAAKKRELSETVGRFVSEKICALPFTDGNLVLFEEGLDADAMRLAANIGKARCSGVFGIFCGCDSDGYRYILSSKSVPLKSFARESIHLPGGGGGSDEMQQGMFRCKAEEIKRAFG